ncbi:MAG: glycosyltransferase involved in cell wall biosynthesis [Bacteroidia bacterium]|jgi:glycosyltransferase involved in cell wall biosynthesis
MVTKLLIISHTPHYLENDVAVGWGPTINEINFLSNTFTSITHVACLFKNVDAAAGSVAYVTSNVTFKAIPPFGGEKIVDKLRIFTLLPKILRVINKELKTATHVQVRLPMGLGNLLLPYLTFKKRRFLLWFKYAGNWDYPNAPLGYRFQKWWLSNNLCRAKVTLNGFWEKQPEHCYSFENPSLTDLDIQNGKKNLEMLDFQPPYRFIFVGRLIPSKGVDRIIEALKTVDLQHVAQITFVGNGPDANRYKEETSFLKDKVNFPGFLHKDAIHALLRKSHFLLLPSDSEGFPKVVTEAACYGCLSLVTSVSAIPHYVKHQINGFLWDMNNGANFGTLINLAMQSDSKDLKEMSQNAHTMSTSFTFENYHRKLEEEIFANNTIK